MIILNHAGLPDRTKIILSGNYNEFVSLIIKDALSLQNLGVANIAIPCNTSHYFYEEIQSKTQVPIINMVKESVDYAVKKFKNISAIGILATDGTNQTKIYENECEKRGIKAIVPSKHNQEKLMEIIYGQIKKGEKGDLKTFNKIIEELNEKKCNAIILACTELSYFKEYHKLQDNCIDSLDVLVEQSILLSGKKLKKI